MNKPTENIPAEFVVENNGKLYIRASELCEAIEYAVEIDSEPAKHDISIVAALLLFNDEFYQFSYFRSYNHGVSEDAGNYGLIESRRVKPVEVTKIEWVFC